MGSPSVSSVSAKWGAIAPSHRRWGYLSADFAAVAKLRGVSADQIQSSIAHEAAIIEAEISDRLNTRILALERMAKRWEVRGGTPQQEWEADAAIYLKDFSGWQAIEWIDATAHVRWVAPSGGTKPSSI
ncbi:MAG: hypothetical protein HC899_27305 [Leptolyngbyaceae cyanobacterium SM1_4_3]|nr:hypothetical protein [Leptolyngbyaceae cyanobacterium SM1_4_3]